ncbi:MAG TPA: PKD domain-containing protein [Solirubrobacteraceae bacterium]|nr:PKD domain-containing protein [Solirubrobacteraceae bacterium]
MKERRELPRTGIALLILGREMGPRASIEMLMPRACALLAGVLLALAMGASRADGVILPATTLDGPGEDIVGFGGAAMAEDGTGGVVYLKRVEGVTHVFVSRFVGGRWLAPIRVDIEEPYGASWPRIGAANGGELIVSWATPFATRNGKPVYELLGSELGPGAESFGRAIFIDSNIEEATATDPDLAVSSSGQADIVYRVVQPQATDIALLRPGDVVEQVRLAHFNGQRWSNLGAINRNPSSSMRAPTQANAPAIAIGPTGNAVVVWQEPDVEGVARVWARRLFGTTVDYVMPVSATTYNVVPISTDADAPSVAFSRLGQAEVAYRQPGGPGSPLPGPRIFLNVLPDGESANGAEFEGARVLDPGLGGGAAAVVGPPSIDIDEQQGMRLLYDANGTPRVIEGAGSATSPGVSLGPPFAGAEPFAVSVMDPQGGGVSAWPSEESPGHPAVAVREDFPGGAFQTGLVSGGAGGEVGELSVGRSGLGDGIIAFRQGEFGNAAIVAAQATAPPAPFVVTVPKAWVRPSQAQASWLAAPSAAGPITYRLVLDGHVGHAVVAGKLTAKVDPRGLSSGRHRLQVLAVDRNDQSTLSAPAKLLVAGVPPRVKIVRAGRRGGVSVTVSDRYAGVAKPKVSVSFGDGSSARGRVRVHHRYARPGVYLVTVRARDRIGNAGTVRRWVSVR